MRVFYKKITPISVNLKSRNAIFLWLIGIQLRESITSLPPIFQQPQNSTHRTPPCPQPILYLRHHTHILSHKAV